MEKRKHIIGDIISTLASLVLLAITIYFCLDMFEIIYVPTEYSLVDLLGSTIRVTQSGEAEEETQNEEETPTKKPNVRREVRNKVSEELISPYNFENISEENNDDIISSYQSEQNEYSTEKVKDYNKHYYNQLDIYGKLIYDELYRHVEDLKTGTYTLDFDTTFNQLMHEENGAEVLENAFQLSVNSLVFDKPEIFYLDITKMYLYTEITTFGPKKTYRISIGPASGRSYLGYGFNSKDDVDNALDRINQIVNDIVNSNSQYSTYDRIKAVHDYIIDNADYDSHVIAPNIYNMYGIYGNGYAVCEGYAKAFKYAMDRMGIPSVIACGIGVNQSGNTESHAWNYVQIDDNWYAVDPTWDDPIIIGYGNATYRMRYHYFLVGSNTLFQDHQEDGNLVGSYRFTYPAISQEDYR